MRSLRKVWVNRRGAVGAGELLLLNTILLLGTIAGLTVYRDEVVQEFGDLADALQSLDQSYTVYCTNMTFGYVDSGFPAPVEGGAPGGLSLDGSTSQEEQ